jgi:quercetin dioxygenase-like cupin family protein
MKHFSIRDIRPEGAYLLPEYFGDGKVTRGGVYVFKPGENSHPEARHTHDVTEVFIIVQGSGVLPIDGVAYPVKTGDVWLVEPGEDHHLTSSQDDPMVAVWYKMDR